MWSRWEACRSITERIWTQRAKQPRGGLYSDQHLHISHQIVWSTWGLKITQTFPSFMYSCLSLSSFIPSSVLICFCAVLHAGPRLASGTTRFTVWQRLDGGEWKRRVLESEESSLFMSHSPTSPPALKQIAPAGIRSLKINTLLNQTKFQSVGFSTMNSLCKRIYIFFFHCPAGMDTISVPLENNTQMHTRSQVCQSKVCGDRWAGSVKTSECSSCGKCCDTYHLFLIFPLVSVHSLTPLFLMLPSYSEWHYKASCSADFIWNSGYAIFNEKTNNAQGMILIFSDTCMMCHTAFHPVILGLQVAASNSVDFPCGP